MAANPKTQMVKLAIGAVTVSSVVGVTGWLWQTTHPAEASAPAADSGAAGGGQSGQAQPDGTGGTRQRRGQPGQGFGSAQPPLFSDPNAQPSQRSRTRHS